MGGYISWLITNETAQTAYLYTLLAVLVLPMVGLAVWFNIVIHRTEGGRRLMAQQSTHRRTHGFERKDPQFIKDVWDGLARGDYGPEVTAIYGVVWRVIGMWLLALAVLCLLPFVLSAFAG